MDLGMCGLFCATEEAHFEGRSESKTQQAIRMFAGERSKAKQIIITFPSRFARIMRKIKFRKDNAQEMRIT